MVYVNLHSSSPKIEILSLNVLKANNYSLLSGELLAITMFKGKLFLMGRCSGIYYLYNYFFITEATILYIFCVFALEKAKHIVLG